MSATNFSKLFGFRRAFVSWKKSILFAGAAALGDEEELVGAARRSAWMSIWAGRLVPVFDLLPHVERRHLGIPQVLLGEALVDAAAQPLGVVRPGPDLLALLREDGGRAGVLAHRQDPLGGDLGVLQQRQRHVAVVRGGLRVVEDRGQLLQVARAQQERAVAEGVPGRGRRGRRARPSGSPGPRTAVVETPSFDRRRYSVASRTRGRGSW